MKKFLSILMVCLTVFAFTACGKESAGSSSTSSASYGSALEVFNLYWDNVTEKYPSIGGLYAADNAPADLDLNDASAKDMVMYTFFVPEAVAGKVTECASMIHMMNGNVFSGLVMKIDGMDTASAISALKDGIKGAQFMCGSPDQVYIAGYGSYVFYAFGENSIMDELKTILNGKGSNEFSSNLPL